ncbi:MAG: sulfatase family protein [Acidimicrobiia bacterium]
MRPRSSVAVASAVVILAVLLPERMAPSQTAAQPNVVVIVTDDQRADALVGMPQTRAYLGDGGATFSQAFVATPLCCPSRASILTGRYAHNNGVRTNRLTGSLDHTTTMQAALKTAGYQTAIAGKFLLYWDMSQEPPNFDRWAIVNETDYYGDYYDIEGERTRVDEYSTDFIAGKALEYLDAFEADDTRPFFLYLATQAPHDPFVAEPDYENATVPEYQPAPSVHEEDRTDKPDFVSVHRHGESQGRREREAQLRTLYSVDDLVGTVAAKLAALGEDNDTLVIFTSDNGYFWGEHGQKSKSLPYTEGIHVPLMMRFPGRVAPATVDSRWASVIDVAPTVLEAAGLAPAGPPMDGTSLLAPSTRTEHFVEYSRDPGFRYPPWASLRDASSQYMEYYEDDGTTVLFREYYDLVADPYQMENLLADADPANDPDVTARSARLAQLATCSGRIETGSVNPCP